MLVFATRAKQGPNLLSLSRIRYFGASPYGLASRSCWATQASVGERVTPTWITFRDSSSTTKKAKSGRKKRSVTGKRVARPDLSGVVAQKRAPLLTSRLVCANRPHVLLNSSLAHTDAQFQQFPTNPFSTPKPIVLGHLPDQGDRFCGDLGLVSSGLGLTLPIQTEELPRARTCFCQDR